MNQKEIFNLLAVGLIEDIPQESFEKAILDIICLQGTVEFKSYIITITGDRKNLEVIMGYKYAKAVLELYNITQSPKHINWIEQNIHYYQKGKWK